MYAAATCEPRDPEEDHRDEVMKMRLIKVALKATGRG